MGWALALIYLVWGMNWVVMKTANLYFPSDAVCRLPLCSWRGEPFTPWIACGMALILAGIVVVVQALRPLCTLAGQPCGVASRIAAMERRFLLG